MENNYFVIMGDQIRITYIIFISKDVSSLSIATKLLAFCYQEHNAHVNRQSFRNSNISSEIIKAE